MCWSCRWLHLNTYDCVSCQWVRECKHASVEADDRKPSCKWLVPIAPGRAGEVEGDLVADGHATCIGGIDNISPEDDGAQRKTKRISACTVRRGLPWWLIPDSEDLPLAFAGAIEAATVSEAATDRTI